jgi:peroxiredoxin
MPFTLSLGDSAPYFSLAGVDGRIYSTDSWRAPVLVFFFTCNHCPYVVKSEADTRALAEQFSPDEVQFVAINSNSPHTYQEDRFSEMVRRAEESPFPWPYLYDPDQAVARSYGALRTPHFYIFDKNRLLRYCGREFDRPREIAKGDIDYVEQAIRELLQEAQVSVPLTNPVGCNVKWEGKDAHWMPPKACDLV